MSINMFHPGKHGRSMQCSSCHKEFGLLFACNGCSQPVCFKCGLLKKVGQTQLYTLIDNVNVERAIDNSHEIGLNEWLDERDPQEQFLCPTCH